MKEFEVVEIVDNRTGKVLFTLRFNYDSQDYTLTDEYGLTLPSVSVYTKEE